MLMMGLARVRIALGTPLVLAALLLGSGCAAPTVEESTGDATGAVSAIAEYDAIIKSGTKVETNSTPTAAQSASTTLLGWIPKVEPDAGVKQILTVARWSEIRDADGAQPFTSAKVTSDSGSGNTRKLAVKLTLDGGVELDVKVVATEDDKGIITVRVVNTSLYKVFLVGTVLEPEKLVMELKLIPYKDGIIVDATSRVKLSALESKAPPLTASIKAIFDWLKGKPR